jgi:hypothetical protein
MSTTPHYDKDAVKRAARGRWLDIIAKLGRVDPAILDGRHGPCPRCQGTDRFRAFDDVAQSGGLFCNNCHDQKNGDGFSALQWLQGWDFAVTLRKVAEYLGLQPSTNGHAKKNGKAGDLQDQVEWSKASDTILERLGPAWCQSKPPIKLEALKAAGVKFCRWPKKAPSAHRCLALAGRKIDGDNATLAAVLLYNLDAPEFPAFGSLDARKTHLVKGSTESWIWAGNVDTLKAATAIVKVEGPSDLLALLSIGLPAGWVAITNACGAKSANPKKLDFNFSVGKPVLGVGDADEPGQEGIRRFAAAFHQAGAAEVRIVKLPHDVVPDHGKDLRDWLSEGHTAADFATLADTAPIVTSKQAAEWGKLARPKSARSGESQIVVGVDESRVVNEAIAALSRQAGVYQRGGMLVQVVRDADPPKGIDRLKDAPRIAPIELPRLQELLSDAARWMNPAGEDDLQEAHPPAWAVKAVRARGEWRGVRRLEGITESPTLRVDGSILQTAGYDQETGLLYTPQCDFPPIPDRPSKADAERSRDALLEVVVDFPFKTDQHRSTWLAGLLTPFARFAFPGPSPLFLFEANTAGTGKSLLCDTISIISTGREMARTAYPDDDNELRKRITSIAIGGIQQTCIDNIGNSFGCPSLDAALTSTRWCDRTLGFNTLVTLPLYVTWYASANNIVVIGDTGRRICHARMESPEENPEERKGFLHSDLLSWVQSERPRLACAAVTLLSAYFAAGRPDMGLPPWGSFESWSAIVRNTIVWVGLPDPAETRSELRTRADQDARILGLFMDGLLEIDPNGLGITTAEILKTLGDYPSDYQSLRTAIWEGVPTKDGKFPSPRSIGMKLSHLRQRVKGGRFIDSKDSRKGTVWVVKGVEKCATSATSATIPNPTHARVYAHAHASNLATLETSGASGASGALCLGCNRPVAPIEHPTGDGRVTITCPECGYFFGWKELA